MILLEKYSTFSPIIFHDYYKWNNSSIVHDEVLAHRMGLVPIMVDPRKFDEFEGNDDEPTDRNTLVFKLHVSCGRSKGEDERKERTKQIKTEKSTHTVPIDDSVTGNTTLDQVAQDTSILHPSMNSSRILEAIETPGRPYTRHVYSRDLEWVAQGDQERRFPQGIRPIHEDILLAKLRPGQVIQLEAHARKGVGKDHAKYSPVATAAYRLMPHIEIVNPVYDELAEQLVHLYEPGVFKLVPCDDKHHRVQAVLHNPYACTMSRNYMRDPTLKQSIKMSRIPDHFIFSIESVGMLPPGVILAEALKILQEKCRNTISYIDESLEAEGLNE
jgi:DNA-directed RNA polymerase I and III subunit RPAC1